MSDNAPEVSAAAPAAPEETQPVAVQDVAQPQEAQEAQEVAQPQEASASSDEKKADEPAAAAAAPAPASAPAAPLDDKTIPAKMKALFLTKFIPDLSAPDLKEYFEVKEIDTPVPKSGEVLVKMECSPINPSDLGYLKGQYNAKQRIPPPCQAGFEGSGTVVATGGGFFAWLVKGKRVGVVIKGAGCMWAQYAVVPAMQCLVLPDDVTFEQGSSCFVNPLSVIAMVEIAQARGVSAIVHTAAASQLGKMLLQYGRAKGVEVICVVRKEEQVKILTNLGAKYVVNTSEEKWAETLSKYCEELKCTLAFDAVAGDLTGQVLKAMPATSEIQVYGGLSAQPAGAIDTADLIFAKKKVSGFWLTAYLSERNLLKQKMLVNEVAAHLKTSLGVEIQQSFSLNEVPAAISAYVKNMSAGKVAIKPQLP